LRANSIFSSVDTLMPTRGKYDIKLNTAVVGDMEERCDGYTPPWLKNKSGTVSSGRSTHTARIYGRFRRTAKPRWKPIKNISLSVNI